jgi:hypothetical protein
MKKTYFNPAAIRLPKINSRRMPGAIHAAYKTDGEPDTATEEELLKKIELRVAKQLEGVATKEELDTIKNSQVEGMKGLDIDQLRSLADEKTGVLSMLTRQGLEMQRLEKKFSDMTKRGEDMSLRAQVARWVESNKDVIAQIRGGEKVTPKAMELEMRVVASPMSVATVNPTNSPYIGRVEVEPGINELLRQQPTFWDYLTKGKTGAPTYVWVNMSNPQGAAAWIGPGVPKPGVSFEMVADISNAKKIADSAKATTELLDDIDGMTTFIEQELRYQVMIKVNATMLNSVGSATVPTGVRQLATTYTLTTVHTTNPNMADSLRAAVAQLRSGFLTGPITIFINPVDSANMDMQKATTSGVYMLPPFMTADGKTIAGATVVEENGITAGSFLAGFMRFYRILIYKPFTVSWGWENDDFTRNLITSVGEMRLHQFFNQRHTGAFIYDTYARIIGLIAGGTTLREGPEEPTEPTGEVGIIGLPKKPAGGGKDEGRPDVGKSPVEPPSPPRP